MYPHCTDAETEAQVSSVTVARSQETGPSPPTIRGFLLTPQSIQGAPTWLALRKTKAHLNQRLVFQGDLAIIADFPEGGSKAPFVSCHAQVLGIFHTLGSNPWDPLYAFCRKTADMHTSVSAITWGANHDRCSKHRELTKKLFQVAFSK